MTRRLWLWLLLLVAVALWWLTSRPPVVTIGYPQKTSYQTEIALTGILSPWETELEAPMAGRVQSLPVAAGARVRRGQVLAVVEDPAAAAREAQASSLLAQALRRLDSASAQLPTAEEQLRLARAAVEAAQDQLEGAREEARQHRRERLRQDPTPTSPQAESSPRLRRRPRAGPRFANPQAQPGEVPSSPEERRTPRPLSPEIQAVRQNIQAARAQAEEARKRVRQLKGEIRQAQAEVERQQAALQGLRPRASLVAPADGILTAVHVQKGDSVTASTPLVSLSASERLQVLVPETRLQAAPGQGVQVAAQGQTLAGKVERVDDNGLVVLVPNPGGRLAPGDRVRLDLGTCPVEALAVPASALAGGAVWVVEGEVAHRRPVKTGPARGALVIIEEGLSATDAVVVKGHEGLREGQTVRVVLP